MKRKTQTPRETTDHHHHHHHHHSHPQCDYDDTHPPPHKIRLLSSPFVPSSSSSSSSPPPEPLLASFHTVFQDYHEKLSELHSHFIQTLHDTYSSFLSSLLNSTPQVESKSSLSLSSVKSELKNTPTNSTEYQSDICDDDNPHTSTSINNNNINNNNNNNNNNNIKKNIKKSNNEKKKKQQSTTKELILQKVDDSDDDDDDDNNNNHERTQIYILGDCPEKLNLTEYLKSQLGVAYNFQVLLSSNDNNQNNHHHHHHHHHHHQYCSTRIENKSLVIVSYIITGRAYQDLLIHAPLILNLIEKECKILILGLQSAAKIDSDKEFKVFEIRSLFTKNYCNQSSSSSSRRKKKATIEYDILHFNSFSNPYCDVLEDSSLLYLLKNFFILE